MNEREKGLLGEWYNPNKDDELIRIRTECQDKCHTHNMLLPSKLKERKEIMKNMINTKDDDFLIEQPVYFDYGANITIGERFYSNHNLTILDGAKVEFGNDCFIGPNCSFYTPIHPFDYNMRNQGIEKAKPISVGNNVWFGGSVTVLPGVTIGDNVVIGAGSTVTKNVPSNVVVAGNPAKIIKSIEEGIENERKEMLCNDIRRDI